MKDIYGYLSRLLICLCFSVILLLPNATYAAICEKPIAKVVSVQGNVEAQRVGETQWQPAKLNDTFCPGDKLRANRRSRAEVALAKSILRLNANTTLTLKDVKENDTALIDLIQGATYFFSLAPKSLEVVTPSANAAVRGTEFLISVEDGKTSMSIFEGVVVASNSAGTLTLARGQSAVAKTGQAPELRVVVRPQDAVQWTLYYPPVINIRPDEFQGAIRQSIEYFQKGDLQKAFGLLENMTGSGDPRFLTYLASLELSVGRVDDARKDINQALSINSNNSDAFALQSIIAIAQNDRDTAFSKAQQAVQADPKSANAQISLSYAQQARFDLKGALTSLQIAVQLEPENALAWARLAELWSAHGNRNKALEAAQKAVSLNPNLSRTQTVLGFAHLTRDDTNEARTAFRKAIEMDQADPLPKLGMGLAKIRDNKLNDVAEGRKDLEQAVSLDPGSSLLRSYLGKAYYEETRSDKASEQFAIAKEKDPKDPTPYLYDAIEKQTTNRPVEALHDLQTAIELNDNRAPYRSKLLLDSDLASRSAALGRIYTDLGFQKRALLEGWLSVNSDPSNFSAHRFLADSYSSLPRHEIARVSELLQSQLLQPINMTPIQPRLGESNLFLISAQGPGALSFNEFNPLFNRNGLTVQTNGIVGSNDTYSGEGIFSGIFDNKSFSLGYSKFDTNGWRPNAEQDDSLVNFFLQNQLTPQTSVQFEFRHRDSQSGDTQLRFFNDFRALQRGELETQTWRLGFHHAFAPGSDVIGNFTYSKFQFSDDFPAPVVAFQSSGGRDSAGGELQYLHRTDYVNFVAGAGYMQNNGKDIDNLTFFGVPFPGNPATIDTDRKHGNVYLYSYIKPRNNLTVTVGVSGDFLDIDATGTSEETNQVNPKFGVIWEPIQGTTLRVAAFRVLKRTLVTQQTLEPTQVAGFNQFFDDFNGTQSWRLGGAVDQKFSKSVYGGAEYTYRDMEVPVGTSEADWEEQIARAYLFWAPHEWLALTSEYRYETLERIGFNLGSNLSHTHTVPLGINFFHPSGVSALLKGTFRHQEGNFSTLTTTGATPPVPGHDDFWTFDFSLKYRLPKRYGFVSVGATNIFREQFNYFDTDINNPQVQPDRFLFVSVTLNLR